MSSCQQQPREQPLEIEISIKVPPAVVRQMLASDQGHMHAHVVDLDRLFGSGAANVQVKREPRAKK